MTGAMDPQGNLRDRNGLLTLVMEKNAGRWEIVVMHNLDLSAPLPPPK
jgi:ketosteroid isomerase-like protein